MSETTDGTCTACNAALPAVCFVFALLLWPHLVGTASAQPAPNVSLTGVGLLSIQPADTQNGGTPYLIGGFGGIGPGFALGVNTRINRRVVLLVEYSTAWISDTESGRLFAQGSVGRLRDGVGTGLVGIAWRPGRVIIQPSAGIGALVRTLTSNGVPLSTTESGRFVFVPGLDVIRSLYGRVDLVVSGRGYLFAPRSSVATAVDLGTASQFVRVGAGIRLRLSER